MNTIDFSNTTNFQTDLERGQKIERLVENYYEDKFDAIKKASLQEEISYGYDYIFYHGGNKFTVEIKNDEKSSQTGNIFIELSVNNLNDNTSKKGCAIKTKADVIMICAGKEGTNKGLYLIKNENLKENIVSWKRKYPIRNTIISQNNNKKWRAEGICVPICEFKKYCFKFISYNELYSKGVE